jgi:hypothetical protein
VQIAVAIFFWLAAILLLTLSVRAEIDREHEMLELRKRPNSPRGRNAVR